MTRPKPPYSKLDGILFTLVNNAINKSDGKYLDPKYKIKAQAQIIELFNEMIPAPTILTPWKNGDQLPAHQYQKGYNQAIEDTCKRLRELE